ncbi:MAG TPA: hypothetical protein VF880_05010 [Actinomycetes bacterium]
MAARWAGWATARVVLAGAALGAAGGPVAACELSGVVAPTFGGCAPAGAAAGALAGTLTGLAAAPLARTGSSRRRPAAHRPAGSTRAAASLVVAAAVAAALVWAAEWAATEEGLEQLVLLVLGLGVAAGGAVLVLLALGLLRRRGWARWGAVVGFSLAAVAALSGLLGTVNGGAATRPAELAPPVVALAVSLAVVVLVLVPATARDFRSAGQPPAPSRPGST